MAGLPGKHICMNRLKSHTEPLSRALAALAAASAGREINSAPKRQSQIIAAYVRTVQRAKEKEEECEIKKSARG